MCLAIPGQVVEIVDEANRLAKVDVAGVQRTINIGLLDDDGDGAEPGDWVLIHVGFALSKVDEEEAAATLQLLEGMGADYEQELAGAAGERDRVSDAATTSTSASPAATTRSPMRVVRVDARPRAGAVRGRGRASARASRSRSSSRSPTATGCSCTPGPRCRCSREVRRRVPRRRARPGAGRRDPGDGRARPPLQGDGGVRRAHPLDLQVRDRRPAAGERRARPRARLPGLRDPDGPRRRRHRDRPRAGRDLHLLRRHAARPGLATARCSRPRRPAPTCGWSTRRSTRCGSPSRTRTARSCSSRSASRPPRRRPR